MTATTEPVSRCRDTSPHGQGHADRNHRRWDRKENRQDDCHTARYQAVHVQGKQCADHYESGCAAPDHPRSPPWPINWFWHSIHAAFPATQSMSARLKASCQGSHPSPRVRTLHDYLARQRPLNHRAGRAAARYHGDNAHAVNNDCYPLGHPLGWERRPDGRQPRSE